MTEQATQNHAWLLASRPHGEPTKENFRHVAQPVPEIKEGEVLLKTIYLSLDPYMRGRMDEGKSYAAPAELDQPMVGGTVCQVAESKNSDFKTGDWVLAQSGWQEYAVSDGKEIAKLGNDLPHPSWALGILGMPGFTAYMGLMDIGQPKGVKPWSLPPQPVRWAQRSVSWVNRKAAVSLVWRAVKRNAVTPSIRLALMPASITTAPTLKSS